MRIRSIDLSHGRFLARLPNCLELKPTLARRVSRPLPSFPMHEDERRLRRGLDESPAIVNWNGLDPTEQAEITLTLETANNWIIFTHPLGAENAATPTPPIPKGAQRILHTKGKAGRERGWWRTGLDKKREHSCVQKFLFLEGVQQQKYPQKHPEMLSATRY